MTYLANVKWDCECGHQNKTVCYTFSADDCGETFQNGSVPQDCYLYYDTSCKACGRFELVEDEDNDPQPSKLFAVSKIT